ncbi:MAG: hypothetical protein HFH27_09350 [Clostridiaceae bacterium]|nr:hypothetical protein [Clostridiaceae bacterium]
MVAIREKWEAGKRICYKEWCRINSYKGWLKWCDSFRLAEKYLTPVLAAADDYYYNVIKRKKTKPVPTAEVFMEQFIDRKAVTA